jgi:hypothetical protein
LLGIGAEGEGGGAEEAGEAPVLQADVVVVVEVVDADDVVTLLKEQFADAGGDEAGAAGDKVV